MEPSEVTRAGDAARNPPAGRSWLTRPVFGFGIASFLSDAGHEAATWLLPALLAGMGSSAPAALGVIEGVSDGLSSFAKLAGGWWADRPRVRKPLVMAGYFITGISVGFFGLATSWIHVAAARCAGWFAKGLRGPARDAMLADAVPRESLGKAFGFHRALDTAGAVAGPLLAVALLSLVPLRSVFLLAVIPGVLAAVAIGTLVRTQSPAAGHGARPFAASLRSLPPAYRRFLAAVFLFGIGDFARSLLILRATELLAPGRGAVGAAGLAVALYAGHNLRYAAASYPVGHLADRIRPQRLLAFGYGIGTATALVAAFATPSLAVLGLLFALAGLTLAFEDTLEGAITASLVDPSIRGTAYGTLAAANGIGDLISSSVVGLLWTLLGPAWAFGAAAAFCLAGTLFLVAGPPAGDGGPGGDGP